MWWMRSMTGGLLAGLLVGLLMVCLVSCSPRPDDAARAQATAGVPATSSSADPSVPAVAAAVSPAAASATSQDDATRQRPRESMTPSQESTAMPMPGQVNNHSSTALDPAPRGASAP